MAFADLTDAELLARARSEPEALGVFYDRHEGAVLAYFVRRTRDAELAADLTAETFAHVVAHCRRGRPVQAPLGWLFRIAANELTDWQRRGRVADGARRRLGMERIEPSEEVLDAITALGDDERVRALPEALGELAPEQREALIGRFVREDSYERIADAQQTTPQAARQRVSRALRTLRRSLERSNP